MTEPRTFADFLNDLSKGDRVFIQRGPEIIERISVEGVTKTQIVLANGERYQKKSGSRVGGVSWAVEKIIEPTPENECRWRKLYLKRWARSKFPEMFDKLTGEQQQDIHRQITAMAKANVQMAE